MGKTILLYVIGTMTIFLIVNFNLNKTLADQSTSSINYYAESQARNIGNSMIAMLTSMIADSNKYRVTAAQTKSLLSGQATYQVVDTVVATDSLIKINVTAVYMNQTKRMMSLIPKPTTGNPLPSVFNYAVFSNGNLELEGNSTVQDDGNNNWNANVHSNNQMEMGGSSMVTGFVTYVNKFEKKGSSTITPNQNPNNLAVSQQVSNVKVPLFNPDDYKTKATKVYAGDFNPSGTLNLGTSSNPSIIYVGGNMNVSGNLKINGFGIIVIKGNAELSGNVTFGVSDPTKSNLGLYTAGDIQMSGNSDFYGQFLALKNIQISGNGNVHGSIAAGAEIENSGNSNILYRPANSSLTTPIFGNGGTPTTQARPYRATAYYE